MPAAGTFLKPFAIIYHLIACKLDSFGVFVTRVSFSLFVHRQLAYWLGLVLYNVFYRGALHCGDKLKGNIAKFCSNIDLITAELC